MLHHSLDCKLADMERRFGIVKRWNVADKEYADGRRSCLIEKLSQLQSCLRVTVVKRYYLLQMNQNMQVSLTLHLVYILRGFSYDKVCSLIQMGRRLPKSSPLAFPERPNEWRGCWQSIMEHAMGATIYHPQCYQKYCHLWANLLPAQHAEASLESLKRYCPSLSLITKKWRRKAAPEGWYACHCEVLGGKNRVHLKGNSRNGFCYWPVLQRSSMFTKTAKVGSRIASI